MFLLGFMAIGVGGEGAWLSEYGDELEVRLECTRCRSGGLAVHHSAVLDSWL